ncbi:MAG: hypothetical protein HY927_12595 [Elusimicrobia bacterium]|nr:hypothetical protein [Elusimicrobiota bacterium]
MKPIPWHRALLLLLLVEFVGLRPHLARTGFHLDDWYEASLTLRGPSYWDGVRGFAASGIYWDRPGNMLLLPLVHRLSGVSRGDPIPRRPWVPQLLSALLEAAEAWLLFLLLERLLRRPGLALAAAALSLLFPSRGGFHYRPCLLGQHVAQVMMLASMLAHLRWRESGRRGALAAAQALYGLGLLVFDTPMLTPLLLAGALAGRVWAETRDPRRAAVEWARCFAPYAVVLAAVMFWKVEGVGMMPEGMNQKSGKLAFSLANSAKVLLAGLGCTTLWPLALSAARLRDAVLELGRLWVFLPVFAGWAALELGARRDEPAPDRGGWGALAGAMAGGFLGTYAPFMVSAHHMPYVNGILSRVNAAGVWVGGLWTAALLAVLPGRWRIPALGLLLAAFTWTNWVESRAWSRAWDLQKDILAALVPQVRSLPPGPATVILTGAPTTIHGAHVFDSNYDLGYALRMLTGREDLSASALASNMEFRGDELVQSYDGVVANRYPTAGLRVYDHATRKLGTANGVTPPPREARSVLFKLLFGPGMRP